MTKQEEVREGIIKNLNEFRWELQKPNVLINTDTLVMLQGAFADKILKDESSQGVVLKVERELPKNPYPELEKGMGRNRHYARVRHHSYTEGQKGMLKAGFVAVEPLIKEKEKEKDNG